ncbi:MAG: hypothetical protein H5T98_05360 [Syntrophomonadaceae bacterium]|nr:hypothetical protein [Syntrophomonadaceae bacterium]
MVITLFVFLIAAVVLIDAPELYKKRMYKELAVFVFFLLIGLYLGMVQLFGWPFYNPVVDMIPALE